MKLHSVAWLVVLGLFSGQAQAHRLDEYLQATTVDLQKSRVDVEMRLAPGVAITPIVLATMDRNADGVLSEAEKQFYGEQVLRDVELRLDGEVVALTLRTSSFPSVEDLREGIGEIYLAFSGMVPASRGSRQLIFENNHQRQISAYLVNAISPDDPDIRIMAQNRNYEQSHYRLEYIQSGGVPIERAFLIALVVLAGVRFALPRRARLGWVS